MPIAIDSTDKIGEPLDLGFDDTETSLKVDNGKEQEESINAVKPTQKPSEIQNNQGNEFENNYNENEELTDYNNNVMHDEEQQPISTTSKPKKPKKSKAEAKKIKPAIPDKNVYIAKLKLQRNKDGSSRFTEDEINEFALEIYGENE